MFFSNLPVWLLVVNLLLPVLLWPLKGTALKIWLVVSVLSQLVGFTTAISLFQNEDVWSWQLAASNSLELSFWAPTWTLLFLVLIFSIGALILIYAYGYFAPSSKIKLWLPV